MTVFIGWGFAELQILKKVKMTLSLELWRILWWNFAYTLILTRCSQWDCQMIFGIGRGFVEVQILKKSETGPIPSSMYSSLSKISFLSLLSSPSVSSVLTNNFLWTSFVGVFTLAHLGTGLCSTVHVGIWSLLSIILILSVFPSIWHPLILNSLGLYLISCTLAFNNGHSKLTYLSGWTVTQFLTTASAPSKVFKQCWHLLCL